MKDVGQTGKASLDYKESFDQCNIRNASEANIVFSASYLFLMEKT